MPATNTVAVLEAATQLPTTLLNRKQVVVHNQSLSPIYVSTSTAVTHTTGNGVAIAANGTLTFPSGAVLYASSSVAQSGGLDSQTVVMELE